MVDSGKALEKRERFILRRVGGSIEGETQPSKRQKGGDKIVASSPSLPTPSK